MLGEYHQFFNWKHCVTLGRAIARGWTDRLGCGHAARRSAVRIKNPVSAVTPIENLLLRRRNLESVFISAGCCWPTRRPRARPAPVGAPGPVAPAAACRRHLLLPKGRDRVCGSFGRLAPRRNGSRTIKDPRFRPFALFSLELRGRNIFAPFLLERPSEQTPGRPNL